MSDWVPTTCMRCAVGCGHRQLQVDAGYGVQSVSGDPTHPVNRGLACQRGIRESGDPQGEWLTRPLVRRDGDLRPTTWDVALAETATALRAALEADRDSVAVLGSGQQTNEAAYALGKLARGGFGTRHYDANTTLCMASAVTAYYDAFGSDAPPPTYDDIPLADSHVIWGANPAVAHPVMFRWIADSARDDDSTMLVVDPVQTETADAADVHISPNPGSDLDLARSILAHVVATGRVDEAFVAQATTGFEQLEAGLPSVDVAAARAGVTLDEVETLAAAFAARTLVYWGMGVNQSTQGTDTAGALIDCCLATGNLRPGSGPFSLTGQANSMGTRICSSKGSWPGQQPFDDPDARHLIADTWGVPVDRLPNDPGPGPVGVVDAIDEGDVDVMYAVATNPVAGLPDAGRAADLLDDVFLVVQDAFRTETVEHANVVLPAATWGESSGTTTNMERRISRVRAATDLPSGVRTDLDIITTLGNRLADGLFGDATSPESVFCEFTALTDGTPADCTGITYDRLDAEHAIRWPAPDPDTQGGYRYHTPAEKNGDTHSELWTFPTPSGNARFAGGTGNGLPEPTDDAYPLTLTTGRESDGYNTGVRTRDSPEDPGPLVARVHPETIDEALDAADTNWTASTALGDGTTTEPDPHVESRRASVPVQLDPDNAVPQGLVWLPIHHPRTNELTVAALDPRSAEPNYKQCAVRLVRADERGRQRETRHRITADGSGGGGS